MPTVRVKLLNGENAEALDVRAGSTIDDVIAARGLNEETFLVSLNGSVAHPSTRLRDGDVLEFVSIIYGG